MSGERIAKHRAAVLRPILDIETKGEPINQAIGDAVCITASTPHNQTNKMSQTLSWSRLPLVPKTLTTDNLTTPTRQIYFAQRFERKHRSRATSASSN